jgi:tRNA A37 threonylcarbamoyladenosine synthetase subunit TsaC/SUA5/YrdC
MDTKKVYLIQTNTTVGFLSQNLEKLNRIKKRPPNKKFLKVVNSFKLLPRVPKQYRRKVRKTPNKITYVINNKAYRVISEKNHKLFLDKFTWMYSTSANESGKHFDEKFAKSKADIFVIDHRGYFEAKPSQIIKLYKKGLKKLR